MLRHSFHDELKNLRQDILKMGTLVEAAIAKAVKALAENDIKLAEQVVLDDEIVNELELSIEEKCFSLLATQQPMARDLRIISTALKIITDLERMGDHARDIAKVCIRTQGEALIKPLIDIPRMAEMTQKMVREVLTAYVEMDIDLAETTCKTDHEIDYLHNQIIRELLVYMMEQPHNIRGAMHLIFVSQYLERIGDHVTNLGEWIVYMVSGERVDLNS